MGHEYFHPALYSLEKGKDKVNLKIKYDRDNTDSVLVFDAKGDFLCMATEKQLLHPLAKFYGTPEQIQEYQEQLNMQRQLAQSTTSSFTDHFENEVLPQLPGTIKKINDREERKQLKKDNAVKKAVGSEYETTEDERMMEEMELRMRRIEREEARSIIDE